jgi:hypothetical protein
MASQNIIAVYLFGIKSECNSAKPVALSHGGIWASETGGGGLNLLINNPRLAGHACPPLLEGPQDKPK